MCIEAFLIVNLLADFALLATVSRAMGLFNWRRVLSADVLCAALATLAARRPEYSLFVMLASPMLAARIITRRCAPRMWSVFSLSLTGQALLCGGIALLAPRNRVIAAPLCLGAGALLALLVSAGRPPNCRDWQVPLRVEVGGRSARFPALIDTGNRLREPVSGLPVLIAEARLLKGLMPEDGYRVLRFGALGGDGRMACFRPDAVWIVRGAIRKRGPDIWVAVAPKPLPGLCQALAPPEFAQYFS